MAIKYVTMPLYEDAYYSYTISLEDVSYVVAIHYVERMQQWIMDLMDAESNPIAMGMALVPLYPIALDYAIEGLNGFFWLEGVADINTEQYKQYPDKLHQYYRMFYIFNEE